MLLTAFGKATPNNILYLEEKYGVKLPNDYGNFLINFNGGDVRFDDSCGIHVEDVTEDIHLDVLLGINTGNSGLDIDIWTDEYQRDMNEGMLIIGHSYEHGFIVLQCAGKDAGVYYWDHSYEFECSNDESNTYFIAATFTEFIKNII